MHKVAKPPKWPRGTVALLSKRINRTASGQDYVDWAVFALTDGFDSPSLAILAGLDIANVVSRFEGDEYFQKAVKELGFAFPDDATVLRRHLIEIAEQIKEGAIDPEAGVERIHREVVSPLGHPSDLQPWCFLWEGLNPDGSGEPAKGEYTLTIEQFVDKWLSEKSTG